MVGAVVPETVDRSGANGSCSRRRINRPDCSDRSGAVPVCRPWKADVTCAFTVPSVPLSRGVGSPSVPDGVAVDVARTREVAHGDES